MKRSRTARLVLMGLSPLALTACEGGQEALIYQTVGECTAGGVLSESECQAAFDKSQAQAQVDSPKYRNRPDCIADFGEAQCGTTPHSQGYFMPFMTGFLIARAFDGGGYSGQPLYRPRTGEWTTNGGYTVGRNTGKVIVDPAATKPQRAITQSRAGFGSRAAARGSWGG